MLLAVTVFGFRETSKPSFCSSCHLIEPFEASWETSSHAAQDVTCTECHFEPGAIGYTKGKIYSLIKLTQFAAGETDRKPEAHKLVLAAACLQCHEYVRDPEDPRYPKDIVVGDIAFPHDFHLNTANLSCADCHSGIVHGELVGEERAQAAADPEFCSSCHTGDTAPILFGEIAPVGREHPGAPKVDVAIWRNIHWRVTAEAATIGGVQYDQIERETCLACHQEPTRARACKACHFSRVPEFSASPQAERASFMPVALFALLFLLFLVAVFLKQREKERFFSSSGLRAVALVVLATDAYVVVRIIGDVLSETTGRHEITATTVWVSYLLLSIALIAFILFEASLLPAPLRTMRLPKQPEDDYLTPRPIRRLVKKSPSGGTAARPIEERQARPGAGVATEEATPEEEGR